MMTDELVDLDEEKVAALDILIGKKVKIDKSYNKKVMLKVFVVGDYAWKVILPVDRKNQD